MASALAGDPKIPKDCNIPLPSIPALLAQSESIHPPDSSSDIFADAAKGSDEKGDGTITKPFKSVGHALAATRAAGAGGTINLRAGTYFLTEQLDLTAADSNLTIQTYPGDGLAWLSGSIPLAGIQWKRVTSPQAASSANVWSSDLSSIKGLTDIMSLRVGGERGILARYPNCNPETELCMKTSTTAADAWIPGGSNKTVRYNGPKGTGREFPCPSTHWCGGCDVEYTMYYGEGGSGCDLLTPPISHFCSANTIAGANVSISNAPHQPYKNPEGARFSAMHGGSWCSFAYSVAQGGYKFDSNSNSGEFTFSGGGQQCNRQESRHGPTVIENVAEELDAPGEFHFDKATRTLYMWYNTTGGTPPPSDGSIVVPLLTTLISVSGSQANPAARITLNSIGIRDTAPAIMAPHMGPSGGDWAVNRNASVVLGGVDGVSIKNSTFWKLDNAGIFIGGFARGVVIESNEFAWLGESAVVSVGDTKGSPISGKHLLSAVLLFREYHSTACRLHSISTGFTPLN
jgi:hypothetical protein